MVAFVEQFAPKSGAVDPKNRAGDFFGRPDARALDPVTQVLDRAGESSAAATIARRGAALEQGGEGSKKGVGKPTTWEGVGTYSAASFLITYGKWEATLISDEIPPRGAVVYGTVTGAGITIQLKKNEPVRIKILSADGTLSPRGEETESYTIGEATIGMTVPGVTILEVGGKAGARGGIVPLSELDIDPIARGMDTSLSLEDLLDGDFSQFFEGRYSIGISVGGYLFIIDEVYPFEPGD